MVSIPWVGLFKSVILILCKRTHSALERKTLGETPCFWVRRADRRVSISRAA